MKLVDLCRDNSLDSIKSVNPTFYQCMVRLEKESNYWTYPIFDIFVVSEFGDVLPALCKLEYITTESYYFVAKQYISYLQHCKIIQKETANRLQNLNALMTEKRIPARRFSANWKNYSISYHVSIADQKKVIEALLKFEV